MTARLEAVNRKQIKMGLVNDKYELKDPTLIGRGIGRDISIPYNLLKWNKCLDALSEDERKEAKSILRLVSRETHAKIFWDKESMAWKIIDEHSTNGVYRDSLTNGEIKLEPGKAYRLENKDIIYIAKKIPFIFVGWEE